LNFLCDGPLTAVVHRQAGQEHWTQLVKKKTSLPFVGEKAVWDRIMPYINVQITRGATREQKSAIVKDMTEILVRVLGKRPEHIHIVIQEIAEEDWGFSGMLTDDWKRDQEK
jgi:4-oxalocrotonate tautomerase